MKHTPGPWKDGPVFQNEGRAIFITDESKPGKWQRRLDDKSGVFSESDARLIAAAPELLAAALSVSDALHAFEITGGRIPKQLDEAWEKLSVQIESCRATAK